jgi:hypothetical protein
MIKAGFIPNLVVGFVEAEHALPLQGSNCFHNFKKKKQKYPFKINIKNIC